MHQDIHDCCSSPKDFVPRKKNPFVMNKKTDIASPAILLASSAFKSASTSCAPSSGGKLWERLGAILFFLTVFLDSSSLLLALLHSPRGLEDCPEILDCVQENFLTDPPFPSLSEYI